MNVPPVSVGENVGENSGRIETGWNLTIPELAH